MIYGRPKVKTGNAKGKDTMYKFDADEIYKKYETDVRNFVGSQKKRGLVQDDKFEDAVNTVWEVIFRNLNKFEGRNGCTEKTYVRDVIWKWSKHDINDKVTLQETITQSQLDAWKWPASSIVAAVRNNPNSSYFKHTETQETFEEETELENSLPDYESAPKRDQEQKMRASTEAEKKSLSRTTCEDHTASRDEIKQISHVSLQSREGSHIDLLDENEKDPEEQLIDKENREQVEENLDKILTEMEKAVNEAKTIRSINARALQLKIFKFCHQYTQLTKDYPPEEDICKGLGITRENYHYHRKEITILYRWLWQYED